MTGPAAPIVDFSVVVAVFNSKESLPELVDRLGEVFRGPLPASHEILLVDDGSTNPDTWPTVAALARTRPEVRGLRLMRNFGRPAAVLAGMARARGRYVVTMDDDLQHPPEELPLLAAQCGHDVVIARFPARHDPWTVRLGSRLKRRLDLLAGMPADVTFGSFLLLRGEIARSMCAVRTADPSLPALLFDVTRDAVNVDVRHARRRYGGPTFGWRERVRLFASLALRNAGAPLALISALGALTAAASVLFGAYLVVRYFSRQTIVPGWTSVMVVTLFLGGSILATLGVIGRALVSLTRTAEARPAVYIREQTGGTGDPPGR